jgi:peptidyl-prolyl cis-trans isomerase SurA
VKSKFETFLEACRKGLCTLLAVSLMMGGIGWQGAVAQEVEDDGLNLPQTINLLGDADPGTRRATARVNGYVITGTDVDQRVALVLDANQAQVSAEELNRLKVQVLRNLIDETLQIQAAELQEIPVTSDEVEETWQRVALGNFDSTEEMDIYLVQVGSSTASLKRQIAGELAMQRLMARNIRPFINVSEEEVNETMKRLNESKGMFEFRVGEIFMAATTENREAVYNNMLQIIEQLRQGGSFVAYARQYSQASTAAVGGDLGWIRAEQLPTQLADTVRQMQPGQLAGPVEIPGGFSIIYLIDRRQVLTADPRDAILSLKQIALDFPAGIEESAAQAQIDSFTQAVGTIRGCGDAERVAATIGATVVANDQIAVRALPEAFQNTMLDLQIGQATVPFGSIDEGVRVLMLCGRDDPAQLGVPDRQQIMDQLEEERVNKRWQSYLRDLRRDAIIEYN